MDILSQKFKNNTLAILTLLYIVGLIATLKLTNYSFYEFTFSYVFITIYALGAILGIYLSRKSPPKTTISRTLLLFGIGNGILTLSFLLWTIFSTYENYAPTYPTIADATFLLFFPILITTLFMLLRVYSVRFKSRNILESILIVIIVAPITFLLIGVPAINQDGTLLSNFFDNLYIIGNIVLLAGALIFARVSKKKVTNTLIIYLLAMIVMYIGDVFLVTRVSSETHFFGDISDLLYMFAGAGYTLGIYYIAKRLLQK